MHRDPTIGSVFANPYQMAKEVVSHQVQLDIGLQGYGHVKMHLY